MRPEEAAFIMQMLGAQHIKVQADKVLCSCIIHQDSSPSAVVLVGGDAYPTYFCSACGVRRSLLGLIWDRRAVLGSRIFVQALYTLHEAVMEDRKADKHRTRLDYKPFGDEPVVNHHVRVDREPVSFVRGTQLALDGKNAERPSVEFTEKDYIYYRDEIPAYMLERGFDEETCRTWGIRDQPSKHRVVFPVREWEGRIRGVSRRLYWREDWCFRCKASLLDEKGKIGFECPTCHERYAKYLHTEDMPRNEMLYGEWLYKDGAVPVVSEGTTDSMRLWQYGVRPPMASPLSVLGAHPGPHQVERLLKHAPGLPVVIVRDNDAPTPEHPNGPGAALFEWFKSYAAQVDPERVIVEVTPYSKDAGEMGEAEVRMVRQVVEMVLAGEQKTVRINLQKDGSLCYT